MAVSSTIGGQPIYGLQCCHKGLLCCPLIVCCLLCCCLSLCFFQFSLQLLCCLFLIFLILGYLYGLRNDSSATGGQPKYGLGNDSDGLRIVPPTSPFDKLVISPPTFVASSSVTKHISYDVFINHCGQDVKLTLASSIYDSLDATGLRVFLDKDELKHGDFFPNVIEEAMASASLHIAIFSEHYAQSPWCLAELAFMLQQNDTKFIPIFYHVEPFTLRWAIEGKGMYAKAFSEYERKNRYASELQRWKLALHQASFYNGDKINNQADEQRVVKNVVNRVMKEMNYVPLEVAKHPVGLDEAVRNFDMITLQSAGAIQIVGIWGMGGSGKTTLAKDIFNKRCSAMNRSSFLFDVRDAAGKGLLVEKQRTFLKDLDVKDVSFDNVDQGKQILKTRLSRSGSALIVLDDVDHIDQLDALLPPKESLGHGSLIIVTTRDQDVLQQWGISAIYPMQLLNATHAKQLFCWHAFLQKFPRSELEDLVENFLNACQGLPLSLKVMGAQLYGKYDKDYWQRTLNKFSQISHKDIKERLKVSYDALDKHDKEMFLDTACLLIGQRKSAAIAAWDAEWDGLLGWETLFNRCLVEVDEDGVIRMHDHLRDLGRDIADGQSPHRLWSPQQTIQIHFQQEPIRIRGIAEAIGDNCYPQQGKIIMHTSLGVCSLNPSSLGLKIFVGDGDFINQERGEISRELVWLQCYDFKHKNLPSWLSLKKLRILELHVSENLEDLWESDADAPLQLRELVITRCNSLQGFPRSIGHLKNLRKILIGSYYKNCDTLSGLPQEFCHLQSLVQLEIKGCRNLSSLPSNFGELTNLQHLNLNGCSKLKMLPDSFKKLTLLEYLNLEGCNKLTIKSELHILDNMTKLRYINLNNCCNLEELRLPNGTSLTELYLQGTSLKELPANIFQLTKLTVLMIGSKFLTTLPTSVGNLSPLTTLKIERCKKLECLPDSLVHLNSLRDLYIRKSGVKCLPKSFVHLQSLEIIDTPISDLSFGSGCMLKMIELRGTDVSKISISGDCCPFLQTLNISISEDLRELETLPATLETVDVSLCDVLQDIRGIRGLKNLQSLSISQCKKLDAVPSLAELTSVKTIKLVFCDMLENIEYLGSLRSVETLKIDYCPEFNGLPSLAELTSLKEFKLSRCYKLEKIEGLESLRSLETLEISSCPELNGLPSLESLRSLRRLLVVANHRSAVPLISNIEKWPREVMICTRPMFDVGSLKSLSEELPNVSVLDYSVVVKSELKYLSHLQLRRPESSANANAILICFIIDCVCLEFSVNKDLSGVGHFVTELSQGKWVWMGVFTQASSWLRLETEYISAYGEDVKLKLEEAWLVMGEEGSIVQAFHPLLARVTSAELA